MVIHTEAFERGFNDRFTHCSMNKSTKFRHESAEELSSNEGGFDAPSKLSGAKIASATDLGDRDGFPDWQLLKGAPSISRPQR